MILLLWPPDPEAVINIGDLAKRGGDFEEKDIVSSVWEVAIYIGRYSRGYSVCMV